MKKLSFLLIAVFLVATAMAQDVIIKKNGEELQAKVLELTPEQVKYKRFDNIDGPVYSIYKHEVFMIKYENGVKDVLSAAPTPAAKPQLNKEVMPADVAEVGDPAPYQIKLNGPRVGVTVISKGELANRLEERDVKRVISQFGWQFETRIFTAENGTSGLVEFVPLIGGLEQGMFLPSISGLIGIRGKSGLEIGVGPNVSLAGAGLAIAAGTTFTSDHFNYLLNLAVVPSKDGTRVSLLLGFNYRQRR